MAKIRRLRRLSTVADIVDAYQRVHGPGSFRRLIKCTKQQISNSKANNHLPSKSYLIVTAALKKIGCEAPPAMWGIEEPPKARAA